jgi:cyclic beta-1,2-glucan synthetase
MVKQSKPFSKKIGLVTEPIVALKRTIKIKPNQKEKINLIIAVGENKEEIKKEIQKYKIEENIKKAVELSKAKNEAQNRYLRIKGTQIRDYQKMMSYIVFYNPTKKLNLEKLPKDKYKQSELWKYGISGDLPIILVKIKDSNDAHVIKEVLKAYEFFRTKNLETELIILDEEKHSYENYVREDVENIIQNNQIAYLKNIRAGIFELSKNEISKEDLNLLNFVATIIIDANKGGIKNALKELEEEYLEKYKDVGKEQQITLIENENNENIDILENIDNLKYYNEYGAFSEDGKEYLIKVNKENRLPTIWSNIMANEKFGTLVTESMGGYSWHKNSRLNRVSAWQNYACYDIPSEIIYLKDMQTKKVWSLGLNPMPDSKNYNVIYGFGYTKYIHKSNGLEQELEIFVPKEDEIKVQILKLKNTTLNRKKIKIVYYMKPVLGEDEIKTNGYINLKYDANNNIICAQNLYNSEFTNDVIYVSNSEKIKSYTGDKNFFIGEGNLSNPESLKRTSLNNENSLGKNPCIAYEIEVEIESLSEKEIIFILGAEETIIDSKNVAYKYSKIQNCKQELEKVKNYWKEELGKLQVKTPLESLNIMLNGWIIYQTLESRLIGKTGFYQSGGAYGFRDQLQDTLALKYINPEILKKQIIKHSKHQFIEGDVEHWWHDETQRGIRTKFSDDLLWLVYLTCEYIEFTGDYSILEEQTPYLTGKLLDENEDERYDRYVQSEKIESIFEHCKKAIEKSLNFGENGLPKIGTGDWNDGFSTVGNKGKGESIWLGFFLYNVLDRFIPICKIKEENNLVEKYEKIKENLKRALNTNGWDGRWYKRAFMDDGNTLGSMENEECRIDSIAQSWSVISNAGDNDKKYISMESLENHLIDRENGIIKLLDPPFDKGKLEPGYIKAYLPGVRENGGQYTHAAIWVIIAEALLGFGDKATELYRMVNPIEHARTKEACNKYKVEPYVIPADIYGCNNLAGRGGWTWYTGSSSWYYKAGIEYILGLKIKNGYLSIEPCIPKDWKEYSIRYKWKNSVYNISVKNPNNKNSGVEKVVVNGAVSENKIRLEDDGVFNIEVEL